MSIYPSVSVAHPYVYKLTHRETKQFYIGYREANKLPASEDIGSTYWSSSKLIKDIGFDKFDVEIIAEFFNADDAYRFENELIEEAFSNPLCLNKHYTNKELKRKFKHDKPHTAKAKKKMSEALKKMPIETRMAITAKLRGRKQTQKAIEAMKQSKLGHVTSEETKLKISLSLQGEKHHNAKEWVIEKENGEIMTVFSLSEICGNVGKNATEGIDRTMLKRRSASGLFYKGFRILTSASKRS